jgi:hypothetical protein
MSEFSKLVTEHVTPLLKQRGFRKVGTFCRGVTFDNAVYRRGDAEVRVYYQFDIHDYPDLGLRLQVFTPKKLKLDRLYPAAKWVVHRGKPEERVDLPGMLRALARDLKALPRRPAQERRSDLRRVRGQRPNKTRAASVLPRERRF